jgi:hypothetical protein
MFADQFRRKQLHGKGMLAKLDQLPEDIFTHQFFGASQLDVSEDHADRVRIGFDTFAIKRLIHRGEVISPTVELSGQLPRPLGDSLRLALDGAGQPK